MAIGSTDKVRIALVGCGRIMPAHLWGYKRLKEAGYERFEITALVARRIEDALRFRKRGEGPGPREQAMPPGDPLAAPHIYLDEFQPDVEVNVYTDYREMLKEERVDAVDIYASLFVHHEIAIAALEAGKHVMVEKPMGITVRACRRMCDAAERAGKVLAVAENARYGQATRMRRWAIEQGLIGKVQMLLHGGIGGFWSPDGIIADTPWRHKKVLGGGGPTIDLGVHFFDVYRYIIGEVDEVYASVRTFEPKRYRRDELGRVLDEVDVDVDDTFFAIVHFKDGAIGQITFSWAGRGESTHWQDGSIIYGSRGCIKGSTVVRDDGMRADLTTLFTRTAPVEVKERLFPFGITDTFALETYEFLRAIEEGREAETSGYEGLRDVAASYALIESSLLNRPVKVDDVVDGVIDTYQREIDEYHGLL